MPQNDFATITLKASGKNVQIPRDMFEVGDAITIRQYAYESGQATKEEAGISNEFQPPKLDPVMAGLVSAGKTVADFDLNVKQAFSELFGDDTRAQQFKDAQSRGDRLTESLREDRPVSTFLGGALPYFAAPGGKAVQTTLGAVDGALQGDTAGERLFGAGLGAGLGFFGQKLGDKGGARLQNKVQTLMGNPNASARKELLDAGIPMSLSQRTDGPISKPLATFFERGKFVLTGKQPQGAAQQQKVTQMITDALGVKGEKLTREVLGDAVSKNQAVFRGAAQRVGKNIKADAEMFKASNRAAREFADKGTDSPQVQRIFDNYIDAITNPNGISPDEYLKLRSNLSEATLKSDIETDALVEAIQSMDDQLARLVPDLADDLSVARDRFRLLLAIRRGSALSPQGDLNLTTLTKNLERVFRDFDANKPLPGKLRDSGEVIAALNQLVTPFRSSGSAENAAAVALPTAGASDPSAMLRALMGLIAPFSGGGTPGLLGGGTGRAISDSLLGAIPEEN